MEYNCCDPTYYDKLRTGEITLYNINGIVNGCRNLICDVCIKEFNNEIDNNYVYCYDCKLNICNKCFADKNNDDGNCNHEICASRQYFICDNYLCELCNNCCEEQFYHKIIDKEYFISINICNNCAETNNGKKIIFMYGLILLKNIVNDPQIGNINDWLPVFKTYDGYLLVNINKESEYFDQLATLCFYENMYFFHSYYKLSSANLKNVSEVIEFTGIEMFMRSLSVQFHNYMLI